MEIYSIFGVCEAAAANVMIEERKLAKIPKHEIPESELRNEAGDEALFAVVVPQKHLAEFQRLCAEMRS